MSELHTTFAVDYKVKSDPCVKQKIIDYLISNPTAIVKLRCHPDLFGEVSHGLIEDHRLRLQFQEIPRQERGDYHCYFCKKWTATKPGADYCDPCSLALANALWNFPGWNKIFEIRE